MNEAPSGQDWLGRLALAFYGASAGFGSFRDALDLCASELGADTAFYYVGAVEPGRRLDTHVSGALSPDRVAEYTAIWAARNARQRIWVEVPDGHAFDFERVMPAEAFVETEVWRHFMRRHVPMLHAVGLAITLAPGLQARFGIGRTEASGRFPAEMPARFALLAPHLRRAARARLRLIEAEASALLSADALARLDLAVARYRADGRFAGANAALRHLVAARDGLSLGPAGLEPARPGDRAALADAIRRPETGTRLAIPRLRSALSYLIDIAATGSGAVLAIVTDPVAPPARGGADLAGLFGLTEGQASLAHDVAAGLSLPEHARGTGIPLETARSRLKAVLARTGCRRQADLAALLARLPRLAPGP